MFQNSKNVINVLCSFINLGIFKVGQSLMNNRFTPNWVLRLPKNKLYKKPQKKNQQISQPFAFTKFFKSSLQNGELLTNLKYLPFTGN